MGYTEPAKAFTCDGNPNGENVYNNVYRITSKVLDLTTVTSFTFVNGGQSTTMTKEEFIGMGGQVTSEDIGADDMGWLAYTISTDGDKPVGTYIWCDENGYVSHIEFAETVHTIAPKYLPSGMGGGMPVFDFTDLKDAWEPFGEDETIIFALIPVERAAEAVQSIYSLFASKKYTPVTVAVQLYDDILILPCAVAMQEGGARLCGEVHFGTGGSIYVIVTLSNTDVVKPHIVLQMA